MTRFRSLLSLTLAAIAVFVIGCSSASVSQPTTYSAEKVAELQVYTPAVTQLRDRFPELETYIQNKDWVNIRSFIHGPMGELRARLGRVAVRLLPKDAAAAKDLADDLAVHLEKLDAAAADFNQVEAGTEYRKALDAFDAFLSLLPEGAA